MLQIETEILEDHQARLSVTVPSEQVQKEMKAAARRISKRVNIPGFRKGKAPYHVIVRHLGEEFVFEEALEPLGQAIYIEALQQSGVAPYAPGTLHEIDHDPLILTFTIPLAPEVDLGTYRDVRMPFEVEEVTNEDVGAELEALRDSQAALEPVERPIEMGDVATLDIEGVIIHGGDREERAGSSPNTLISRERAKVLITEDSTYPVPGFSLKILGMVAGEERDFDIVLATDDDGWPEDLRGKTVHFEVKCSEVHRRDLPELDDEFAQSVGDYDSLLELRAGIRARLEGEAERAARDIYAEKLLTHLVDEVVTINYPPIMLEEEVDEMLQSFDRRLRGQRLNLEDYLRLSGQTEEELRKEFRDDAKARLARALILSKLTEVEKISISDEEIDDYTQTMILSYGSQAQVAQQLFSSPESKRSIAMRLLTENAIARLIQIGQGEAPDLDALEIDSPEETGILEPLQSTQEESIDSEQVGSGEENEVSPEITDEQPINHVQDPEAAPDSDEVILN